jgi:glycosyltransferase involved in cell wall biosynthesis
MTRGRPRVAFVVPRYGPDVVGGAETLVRGFAEHLAAEGHAVEVLTTCARDHFNWANVHRPGALREHGVVVRRFPVRPRDGHRYVFLEQRILRRRPLPIDEERQWVEASVASPELFAHLAAHHADHALV